MGSRSTTNPKSTAVARETDRSPACAVNSAPLDYALERQDFEFKNGCFSATSTQKANIERFRRKNLTCLRSNSLQMSNFVQLGCISG